MTAESYMDAVHDERVLNELKAAVRALPPAEASARVSIYASNRRIGLRVANACSRDNSVFNHILLDGLSTADPSTIRQWVKCVVPRIGLVATVKMILSKEDLAPSLGEAFVYWIEALRFRPSKREVSALTRLRDILSVRRKAT